MLLRSVRAGSSARTVPMPVRMASDAWRRSWTSCAGGGAGEPVGLVGEALRGWGGELAVGGEGGLEGDEGPAVLDEVGEGVVELAGLAARRCRG